MGTLSCRPEHQDVYFEGGPWDGQRRYFEGPAPDLWYILDPAEPPLVDPSDDPITEFEVFAQKHTYHLVRQYPWWVYRHQSLMK